MLDTAQRAYLTRAEKLLAQPMSPIAVALIKPTCEVSFEESDTVLFPVANAELETIVDVPRGANRSNARIVSTSALDVSVDKKMPWRTYLRHTDDRQQYDMAVGPLAYEQQRSHVYGDDPVAAPRSGILYYRLENDKMIFSIGTYLVQNKCLRWDVLWVPVKDAKSTLVFGKFPLSGTHGEVHWGRIRAGDTFVTFDRPVKHQIAKTGLEGQPLLEQNSPLAMPPGDAIAMHDQSLAKMNAAMRMPVDAASGFSIYEMAYIEEFEAGISSTKWDASQVSLAAAGMLDSFVRLAPVMFPEDATVTAFDQVEDRLHVTLDSGKVWSLPAAADVTIACRQYQAFEHVGVGGERF